MLPLALYLLSFVVVFEGREGRGWYVRRWWLAPVLAAVITMAWALSAHRGVLDLYIALPIFCVGLFLCCVFCHGELAATKPEPAWLTQFYLCLAAGGVIGGLFVALIAPQIFVNYWEGPIALVGLCVVALVSLREARPSGWLAGVVLAVVAIAAVLLAGGGASFKAARDVLPGAESTGLTVVLVVVAAIALLLATYRKWPVAIVITALVCTSYYGYRYYAFLSKDTLVATRNFYGALRVKDSGTGSEQRRDLLHGVILHGDQYLADDRRREATTYYGPDSGIGLALQRLRSAQDQLDVAMIGLGSGTLASWGEAGDRYRIYEINPAMVAIAHRDFTYLSDSKADIAIVMGDARLSMERELRDGTAVPFDVIAVDAFSSDSIPVHLITREALEVFTRHLKPDGVIAFHVSNRFLKLAPVVAQLATDAGLMAFNVIDNPDDDITYAASEWVLVHQQPGLPRQRRSEAATVGHRCHPRPADVDRPEQQPVQDSQIVSPIVSSSTLSTTMKSSSPSKKSDAKTKAKVKPAKTVTAKSRPSRMNNRKAMVRNSPIHGRGVVARIDLSEGERICEYIGERIDWPEALRRHPHDPEQPFHTFYFSVDDDTVIDGNVNGDFSRFMNHSCEPNCEAELVEGKGPVRIYIQALRAIPSGEELTYNYGLALDERYTAKLKKQFACYCGSPKCRGTMLAPKR